MMGQVYVSQVVIGLTAIIAQILTVFTTFTHTGHDRKLQTQSQAGELACTRVCLQCLVQSCEPAEVCDIDVGAMLGPSRIYGMVPVKALTDNLA